MNVRINWYILLPKKVNKYNKGIFQTKIFDYITWIS